jgi:uncharacterized repeat protein (TIGR03803 family)
MNGEKQVRGLPLRTISRTAKAALTLAEVCALAAVLTLSTQAQSPAGSGVWTEKVLHSFDYNGTDGWAPFDTLIRDSGGNLYGTTEAGGTYGEGTVFELTPTVGGGWTEQVLHSFGEGTDGTFPYGSLIFDAAGNLYGATGAGGNYTAYCAQYGCGTIFELAPNGDGSWTETVLYKFCSQANCADGAGPNPYSGSLIFDASGNLYGTTYGGGTPASNCNAGCGTVFELTPTEGGGWTETVLASFGGRPDSSNPSAGLIFDAEGDLYGTAIAGGVSGEGTVFELTPAVGGGWTETILHSFSANSDGAVPFAGVIFDAAGNLYGTTAAGGVYGGYGTVFELTPQAGGGWTEQVLHSFGNGLDGFIPAAGLILDASGNLYGTTSGDCTSPRNHARNCGTVFQLTPTEGGNWTETVLRRFNNGTDGSRPWAGLIFDAAGNLYGATQGGGTYGFGTVFELSPPHPCATCSHAVQP